MTDGPFEALLASAERDAEAATGLALAYADMHVDAREGMLRVLIEERPIRVGVLALLLGVEESPELAMRIAMAIKDAGGTSRQGSDEAWAWGGHDAGGVALFSRLHGGFLEAVTIAWTDDGASHELVPLAREDELVALKARFGIPGGAARVSLEVATDRLAEGLWRLRLRRGELPETLAPLAGLFAPRA
ncbi:MAG: hypothetical protein AB7S26_26945 [Sandaracinaceae bacterium]